MADDLQVAGAHGPGRSSISEGNEVSGGGTANNEHGKGGIPGEEDPGPLAAAEVTEVREERSTSVEAQRSVRDLSPESPPTTYARYPLNSRRLTAYHLRTLAKALGLPTSGFPDQLRQCVEDIVQRDRDHHNVIVVVQETPKTEQLVTLEDCEGEFLRCDLAYRDSSARRTRVEDTTLVQNLRQQLEEAEQTIASSVAKEMEQAQEIVNLQEALASKDDELAHTH